MGQKIRHPPPQSPGQAQLRQSHLRPSRSEPAAAGSRAPEAATGPTLNSPTELPRLPGIRRMVVVGGAALFMVLLAIAAALFEYRHDLDVRHQYEDSLTLTHLAFDAESLATRMHTWEELLGSQAGNPAGAQSTMRSAVRSVDIDRAELDRRLADALALPLTPDARVQVARLQASIGAMRAALGWPTEIPADGAAATAPVAVPVPDATREAVERAYLAAIEAAQATLRASVRSGSEPLVIGGHTESEVSAAIVVGASLLALLLGGVLAAVVHRAQHENRAAIGVMGELLRTDPLTGITNRRGLDENLPVELARARRNSSALTVAMIDLDFFKRYNSRRGHAGGDSLLRIAAQSWRKQLRPTDTLVRYGGEEFTLVLPNCDAAQATQLIDRLRPVMPDGQTFSAGVATWDQRESGDDLLRRADEALLAAKKQGRNRTIVSGREEQISLDLNVGR